MYRITFCLGDLRDPELARQQLLVLLGALVDTNVIYLREHPRTPSVREFLADPTTRVDEDAQGVQPPGQEAWQDVSTLLKRRRDGTRAAGSRDLVAWRMAELIVSGQEGSIGFMRTRPNGETTWRPDVMRPARSVGATIAAAEGDVPELVPGGGVHQGYRPYQNRERITFVLDLFDGEEARARSHATLSVLLHALTYVDVLYLRRHPETPRIYDAPVRYMEEPPGQEEWQDVPTCLEMGDADCEDLASWRAAELQVFGDGPQVSTPSAWALISPGRAPTGPLGCPQASLTYPDQQQAYR